MKERDRIDPRRITMNKTYSVTYYHTQLVSKLASELTRREKSRVSDGEVIRRAIDLLDAQTFGK